MLHPEARLEVLDEALQETDEVLGVADVAGDRLYNRSVSLTRRDSSRTFEDDVWQHRIGQDHVGLARHAGVPQSFHQPLVLVLQLFVVILSHPGQVKMRQSGHVELVLLGDGALQ
jgi:hypothetical protein